MLLPIITKAGLLDVSRPGRPGAGPNKHWETARKWMSLSWHPDRRLAVLGRDDEAVPGDLGSRANEPLGLGVAGLVRQVNEKSAARTHGLDDVDGF